jgi:hypothetical protein
MLLRRAGLAGVTQCRPSGFSYSAHFTFYLINDCVYLCNTRCYLTDDCSGLFGSDMMLKGEYNLLMRGDCFAAARKGNTT